MHDTMLNNKTTHANIANKKPYKKPSAFFINSLSNCINYSNDTIQVLLIQLIPVERRREAEKFEINERIVWEKSDFSGAGRFEGDFPDSIEAIHFFLNKRLGCWHGRFFFRRLVWDISTIDERCIRGRRDAESERKRKRVAGLY